MNYPLSLRRHIAVRLPTLRLAWWSGPQLNRPQEALMTTHGTLGWVLKSGPVCHVHCKTSSYLIQRSDPDEAWAELRRLAQGFGYTVPPRGATPAELPRELPETVFDELKEQIAAAMPRLWIAGWRYDLGPEAIVNLASGELLAAWAPSAHGCTVMRRFWPSAAAQHYTSPHDAIGAAERLVANDGYVVAGRRCS